MDVTKYAELFLTESREHLSAINDALLTLERADDPADAVGALFRAVHTLKGMSATLGYTSVATLAHEMESLLDRVRRGEHAVTPETVDALLAGADALESSVERAVAGDTSDADAVEVAERLRAVAGPAVAPLAAPASAPKPLTIPPGPGVLVRVQQAPETDMPGVRAFLLLQHAKSLGNLVAVSPTVETLQAATTPQEFAFRLKTDAKPDAIAAHMRGVADVASVVVGDAPLPAKPRAEPGRVRPTPARRPRRNGPCASTSRASTDS